MGGGGAPPARGAPEHERMLDLIRERAELLSFADGLRPPVRPHDRASD